MVTMAFSVSNLAGRWNAHKPFRENLLGRIWDAFRRELAPYGSRERFVFEKGEVSKLKTARSIHHTLVTNSTPR